MYHALRMPLNITRSCSRPLSYEKHAGCSLTDVRRLPQSRSQATHGRHTPLLRCHAGLLRSLASDTGKLMLRARDAAACAALTGALSITLALTAAPATWAFVLSNAAPEDISQKYFSRNQESSSSSSSGNGGIFQGSLASCRPDASCVSTSALSAPRSYMPPWLFAPILQSQAYRWGQG